MESNLLVDKTYLSSRPKVFCKKVAQNTSGGCFWTYALITLRLLALVFVSKELLTKNKNLVKLGQ